MSLLWGVKSFYYDKNVSTDDTVVDINKYCERERACEKANDFVINLTSMPVEAKGNGKHLACFSNQIENSKIIKKCPMNFSSGIFLWL